MSYGIKEINKKTVNDDLDCCSKGDTLTLTNSLLIDSRNLLKALQQVKEDIVLKMILFGDYPLDKSDTETDTVRPSVHTLVGALERNNEDLRLEIEDFKKILSFLNRMM